MQNLVVDYLKLMLVLAGVVALAWAVLRFWLPRISRLGPQATGPIQVVARMPLEPRKNLYIVKAGSEYLLIGTADNSVHMLSGLKAETLEGLLTSADKPGVVAPDFLGVLRRLKRS
jgi:flagellar protein FliO/FliZ